jgi:glutaredoxin-like YruB-family protein
MPDGGREMADKKVVIYSTPTCPHCKRAKGYLTEKGIAFTDYNVAKDRERAKEMIQKSGQMGVPVIMVDDQMVVGFNQSKLDELLEA